MIVIIKHEIVLRKRENYIQGERVNNSGIYGLDINLGTGIY